MTRPDPGPAYDTPRAGEEDQMEQRYAEKYISSMDDALNQMSKETQLACMYIIRYDNCHSCFQRLDHCRQVFCRHCNSGEGAPDTCIYCSEPQWD